MRHRDTRVSPVPLVDGVTSKAAPQSEWGLISLGEACTKIGSGATPRGGKDSYLESGPNALIRSQNVYNAGFRRAGLAFLDEVQADALRNVEVCPDDVLLNITGDSVARVCQVDPAVLPARVNQHVAIIRPDPAVLDAEFLRYHLASPEMQAMLLSWAGAGGTRKPESTDRSLRGRAAGLPERSAGVPAFAGRCRSEEPSLRTARGR